MPSREKAKTEKGTRKGKPVLSKYEQAHRGAPRCCCSSSPSAVVSLLLLSSRRTLVALPDDWLISPTSGANGLPDSKPEAERCWLWLYGAPPPSSLLPLAADETVRARVLRLVGATEVPEPEPERLLPPAREGGAIGP